MVRRPARSLAEVNSSKFAERSLTHLRSAPSARPATTRVSAMTAWKRCRIISLNANGETGDYSWIVPSTTNPDHSRTGMGARQVSAIVLGPSEPIFPVVLELPADAAGRNEVSLHVSPRGEAKLLRGPPGRGASRAEEKGASRLARAGVIAKSSPSPLGSRNTAFPVHRPSDISSGANQFSAHGFHESRDTKHESQPFYRVYSHAKWWRRRESNPRPE